MFGDSLPRSESAATAFVFPFQLHWLPRCPWPLPGLLRPQVIGTYLEGALYLGPSSLRVPPRGAHSFIFAQKSPPPFSTPLLDVLFLPF